MQCGIWNTLARARALPTVALLADVGNDLAYEASVDATVLWVSTALNRLSERGAQAVLNNVPIAPLRTVGEVRYRVLKTLSFPSCRLSRREVLERAEALALQLDDVAKNAENPGIFC